ncbi:MAG: hypothetical protein ACOX52_09320 [Verrucomicrobiota bacterium]
MREGKAPNSPGIDFDFDFDSLDSLDYLDYLDSLDSLNPDPDPIRTMVRLMATIAWRQGMKDRVFSDHRYPGILRRRSTFRSGIAIPPPHSLCSHPTTRVCSGPPGRSLFTTNPQQPPLRTYIP